MTVTYMHIFRSSFLRVTFTIITTVRQMFLFNWYIHGTDAQYLYALLSSQNPGIIKIYLCISINL